MKSFRYNLVNMFCLTQDMLEKKKTKLKEGNFFFLNLDLIEISGVALCLIFPFQRNFVFESTYQMIHARWQFIFWFYLQ